MVTTNKKYSINAKRYKSTAKSGVGLEENREEKRNQRGGRECTHNQICAEKLLLSSPWPLLIMTQNKNSRLS